MDFILSNNGRVSYSAAERRMFALLGTELRSSADLCKSFYGKRAPYNARKITIVVLSSLIRKTKHNKERFFIKKTKRSGPIPILFWLKEKK